MTHTELAAAVDVTLTLGGREVLRGASVDVRAGEVLALVGPNGAGKSTLLAALAADLRPASGTVRLAGREARAWRVAELARHRAVLPQHPALTFPFTAAEVVAMGRAPWARTPMAEADGAIVAACLADCEVAELAGRPFAELSGGEKARVALARVLAQRTALLMLDEPTAALDLRHQELVMRVCRERAGAGDGVVVVLHDLGLAAAHCDRVAVLREGAIAACGPPREVFTPALLSEVYRQPVDVLTHPARDEPIVLPVRSPRTAPLGESA
ncbi:hemin import ATP-binding protein HmuV [Actinorhabdospora filicis]|uniref:Hemin import ATP-binding protein HmuV n=1 Tax=Actinorhabdospora filicis TaxID=1785913 RepID=A0A9W6WD16_9ACTN|nr:heme ABC transporter ATP-binding protein [Actinorhabdospora filicis]GLZ81653.1 hemin import ATP-binding protein HmuV [Actinorhabdospora filicis]